MPSCATGGWLPSSAHGEQRSHRPSTERPLVAAAAHRQARFAGAAFYLVLAQVIHRPYLGATPEIWLPPLRVRGRAGRIRRSLRWRVLKVRLRHRLCPSFHPDSSVLPPVLVDVAVDGRTPRSRKPPAGGLSSAVTAASSSAIASPRTCGGGVLAEEGASGGDRLRGGAGCAAPVERH